MRILKIYKFIVFITILAVSISFATSQNNILPYTSRIECSDSIKKLYISCTSHNGFDKNILVEDDKIKKDNWIARKIDLNIDAARTGTVSKVNRENKIWRHQFTSTGAEQLAVRFSKLKLAPFAYFFVYNPSKTQVFGPFKWDQNLPDSYFVTPFVDDDTLIVELFEHNVGELISSIQIEGLYHGYATTKSNFEGFLNCSRSTWCAEGYEFQAQRKSVVNLIFPLNTGVASATGVFINNKCNNGKLYILSAYHIIDNDPLHDCDIFYVENLVQNSAQVRLEYESISCESQVYSAGTQLVGGLNIVGVCKEFDLVLFEVKNYLMPDDINFIADKSRIYLAGWDANFSLDYSSQAALIHHINAEPKKISINYAISGIDNYIQSNRQIENVSLNYNCNSIPHDFLKFYVNNYSALSRGSSGAPLFDRSSKKVIGILSKGNPDNQNACISGYSWDNHYGYFTKTSRLREIQSLDIWNTIMLNDASFTSCEGIEYSQTVATNTCDNSGTGGTGWNYDANGNGCPDELELAEYETGNVYCAELCNRRYYDYEVYLGREFDDPRWWVPNYDVYGFEISCINPNYPKTTNLDDYFLFQESFSIYTGYDINLNNLIMVNSNLILETSPFPLGAAYCYEGYQPIGSTNYYQGGNVKIENTFIPSDESSFYVNTYRRCFNPVINTDQFIKQEVNPEKESNFSNLKNSEDVVLYPNPTNGLINLFKPLSIESYNLCIFDLRGIKLMEISRIETEFKHIDLSSLPEGLYLINILQDNVKKISLKLVISKKI